MYSLSWLFRSWEYPLWSLRVGLFWLTTISLLNEQCILEGLSKLKPWGVLFTFSVDKNSRCLHLGPNICNIYTKLQQVTIGSMKLVYLSTNLPSKNQPFMWVNESVPWILRGKNLWKIWVFGSELWMDHRWPMVVIPPKNTPEVLHSEERLNYGRWWNFTSWSVFSTSCNFQASKLQIFTFSLAGKT